MGLKEPLSVSCSWPRAERPSGNSVVPAGEGGCSGALWPASLLWRQRARGQDRTGKLRAASPTAAKSGNNQASIGKRWTLAHIAKGGHPGPPQGPHPLSLSQGEDYSEGPSVTALPRLQDDVLAPVLVEQRGTLRSSAVTLPHMLLLRTPGDSPGWIAASREPFFHSCLLFRVVKHPQCGVRFTE